MRFLTNLFKHIEATAAARERAEQEAYLADATDIYDVEARLRAWDRRHAENTQNFNQPAGPFLH